MKKIREIETDLHKVFPLFDIRIDEHAHPMQITILKTGTHKIVRGPFIYLYPNNLKYLRIVVTDALNALNPFD